MKLITIALTIILATYLSARASEEFPELNGQIEQEIAINSLEEAGSGVLVLLVRNSDNTYRLVTYLKNSAGTKKLSDLPNFWPGGAAYTGNGQYPATIKLSNIENGFAVAVRDPSSNAQNMDLKFRWQQRHFRLIFEKKSASPILKVQIPNSERMSGRWTCSIGTNLLTGDIDEISPRGWRHYHNDIKPRYLDDYVIEAVFMEDICK